MPKLLALLSNPDDEVKLRADREMKDIIQYISADALIDFDYYQEAPVKIHDLSAKVKKVSPDIIHFSGHGSSENELIFEDGFGKGIAADQDALTAIFKIVSGGVRCVLFSACNSSEQAQRIAEFVPFTIGFPSKIEEELASVFSKTFYQNLSHFLSVQDAFIVAKSSITGSKMDDNRLPALFTMPDKIDDGYIFRKPQMIAKFRTKKDGSVETDGKGYWFDVDIINKPLGLLSITYEVVENDYDEKYQFQRIENLKAGSSAGYYSYGNLIIRAWLWFGDKGVGIESTLADSLLHHYKKIPAKLKNAYNGIITN